MKRILLAFNIFIGSAFFLLVKDVSYYFNVKGDLEITFLNVGQGDAILIKTPDNSYGLIDGGRGNKIIEELESTLPQTFTSFKFILITHPDADHAEGISYVLDKYDTEMIFLNEVEKPTKLYTNLINKIVSQNIPNYTLSAINDFILGDLFFDVTWPTEEFDYYHHSEVNDISTSLILTFRDLTFFTAGDLGSEFEELVFSQLNINEPIDIFKAGHHGSKTSSSNKVLSLALPKVVIFSAGLNNSYGHPHEEIVNSYSIIGSTQFRTDLMGRIKITSSGFNDAKVSCENCVPFTFNL